MRNNLFNNLEPLVTIITVVYNKVDTIERTIESVSEQTYKNIEYFVIDGGSTDGTVEIIKKYQKNISFYISEKDKGIYDAMNKGLKKANGEIIGFLNADDWYERDTIQNVVSAFKNTKAEIVHGSVNRVYPDNRIVRLLSNKELSPMWYSMAVFHPATFIRKEVYDRYGLFDEQYKIAADYELLLRFYSNGVEFCSDDNIIVNFTTGGISSSSYMLCSKETISIANKYIAKAPDRTIVQTKCEERYAFDVFREVVRTEKTFLHDYFVEYNYKKMECIIWGAGIWGQRIYDSLLAAKINVLFFVDSDKKKWKTKIKGIEIKNPTALKNYNGVLFIAIKDSDEEIINKLKKYNSEIIIISLKDLYDYCLKNYVKREKLEEEGK